MPKTVSNCRISLLYAAIVLIIAFLALSVTQQAHAATEKINGNVNASSLRSGVDYEVDQRATITIGEDDDVTINSLSLGNGNLLEIKGTNSGSLMVKNGIGSGPGSMMKILGGTINVHQESTTRGTCSGVDLSAANTSFVMSGGTLNISINNSSTSVSKVFGLTARAFEMSGGCINATIAAERQAAGVHLPSGCSVTGGVINTDVYSKTSNACGIMAEYWTEANFSFTNASITASARTDSASYSETCGLFILNDEYTSTFLNCTVISSGTCSGFRSDGNVVINGDSFFELVGKKDCGLDMQDSKLTLEGESATVSFSTQNPDNAFGCARIKQLAMDSADFSFGNETHWDSRDSSNGCVVSNSTNQPATSSYVHSKLISHKLTVRTNRDVDPDAYDLDGYFVISNKTGDAVTKGPRTYAVGEGRNITLTASTSIAGHKFKGWYKSLSGQPISTNAQYTYTMGTADDALIAVFESGKVPVSTLTFTGGKQPVGGQSIVVPSISVAQKGVSVTNVQWYDPTTGKPVSGTFQANKAYSLRITVSLGSSYEWASTVNASLDGQQIGNVSGNKNIWQATYVATDPSPTPPPVETQPMHRLYNPNSGEHFYTAVDSERDYLVSLGWHNEGEGWTAPKTSNTPVYRLYNAYGGEHHYTMDASEKEWLVSLGWNYEGIGWYSDDAKTVVLYREYNPNAFANNHNYTTSWSEHSYLVSIGWRDEGTAWYGVN